MVWIMLDNEPVTIELMGNFEDGYTDRAGNHYKIVDVEIFPTSPIAEAVYIHIQKIEENL